MDIWQLLLEFIAKNPELISLVSLAVGSAGIVLAFVFYKRSKPTRQIAYASRTFRIISDKCRKVAGLDVIFEGEFVPSLSITRMAIWNAGSEPLRTADIARSDPLSISPRKAAIILKLHLLEVTRQASRVALEGGKVVEEPHRLSFDFLNPGDGLMVEITHTGTGVDELELQGSVVGGRVRKAAADPETVTTIAGPHAATTIISVESGRSQTRIQIISVLGLAVLSFLGVTIGAVTNWFDWRPWSIVAISLFAIAVAINFFSAKKYPPSRIKEFDSDL